MLCVVLLGLQPHNLTWLTYTLHYIFVATSSANVLYSYACYSIFHNFTLILSRYWYRHFHKKQATAVAYGTRYGTEKSRLDSTFIQKL